MPTNRLKTPWPLLAICGLTALALGCNGDDQDDPNGEPDATFNDTTTADIDPGECQPLTGADLTGDITLEAGSCHTITAQLVVSNGLLRIEPGTRLIFSQAGGMTIRNDGRLSAVGTAEDPIVFTGLDTTRGYWRGLMFVDTPSSENLLEHTVIEYAGGSRWTGAERSQAGVYVNGPNVQLTVRNSTLRENQIAGITADVEDATVVLDNNRYENNTAPFRLHPNHIGELSADQTFEGNDSQYVVVDGFGSGSTVTRPSTWRAYDVPYLINQIMTFEAPLTIEPGVELVFTQNAGLRIQGEGRLIADADGAEPIIFRGLEDIPGFWRGIEFNTTFSADNILANAIIENAGSTGWHGGPASQAGIFLRGGNNRSMLTIRNTEITGSGGFGISVENESILMDCEALDFEANTEDDINAAAAATVCVD